MDLIVSPAVLIPRPETEHLVETVLELANARRHSGQEGSSQDVRIVDVGTRVRLHCARTRQRITAG